MFEQNSYKTNVENGWEILGPGGGGTMFTPAISPFDTDVAMITCDMTATYITYDGGKNWETLNLKSRVDAIRFDPSTRGTIYAGSSGLYRSTDNGHEWNLIFPDKNKIKGEKFIGDEALQFFITDDNWPGGKIQAIEVDPHQPKNIFIGVGTGDSIRYEADNLILFFSDDWGVSWKELGELDGDIFKKIFVDPNSPKDDRQVYAFSNAGAYKWSSRLGIFEELALSARIAHPTNVKRTRAENGYSDNIRVSRIVSAACGINKETGLTTFFVLTEVHYDEKNIFTGVMRSTDSCQTWQELSGGLAADFHGPENGQRRWFRDIAVAENDCRTAYISIFRHPEILPEPKPEMNYEGIMKTEDAGETWAWSLKISDVYPDNMKNSWQEEKYDTDWMTPPFFMAVHPSIPSVCLYVSQGAVATTTNGGETWEQRYSYEYPDGTISGRNLEVTTCYGMYFDPLDKDHIVFSYSDIGILDSHNAGKSWVSGIGGVPWEWVNSCYWIVFDPEVKDRIWSAWGMCHDLPREKVFKDDKMQSRPTFIGGICKTDTGIGKWQSSNEGLPKKCLATHIILDPKSPAGNRTLYIAACGQGVFKSVDDGKTWTEKNVGLGKNLYSWKLTQIPDGTLYLVNVRAMEDNKIVDGSVFKSEDGAESWTQVKLPAGVNGPVNMDFDPTNPKKLYLACWPQNEDLPERFGGVLMSEDGGITWSNIFDSSAYVFGVTVDKNNPSHIYAVTFQNAAYLSIDYGKTWSKLKGYDFKWGHNAFLDIHNKDMVYITTFGSSVWHGPSLETE